MNYELAKKLKDTGFPQDIKNGTWFPYASDDTREKVYMPTLSELIDACVQKNGFNGDELHLVVLKGYSDARLVDQDYLGSGSTPKEALTNLWLAINKNKHG